jgi:ketosteroid isomerase-like protein
MSDPPNTTLVRRLGHYRVVSKAGAEVDARFIHLWTVRDGKLTHLRQAADSHVVREALNG